MTELKACPFCGSEAILETMETEHGRCVIIWCSSCPATLKDDFETLGKAIEAWNRRVE